MQICFHLGEPSTCGPNYFTCKRKQQCVPMSWRCDKNPECTDQTDEENCPSKPVGNGLVAYLNLLIVASSLSVKNCFSVKFFCDTLVDSGTALAIPRAQHRRTDAIVEPTTS